MVGRRWRASAVVVLLWACGDAGGDTGGGAAGGMDGQDAARGGSGGGRAGGSVSGGADGGPPPGGTQADAAAPGGPLAEAAIGPEGGTLEGPGFRLEVTPGALDHVETLRVFAEAAPVLPADTTAVGGGLRLEPSGLVFQGPVRVTVTVDAANVPDGLPPESALLLLHAPGDSGDYQPVTAARLGEATLRGEIRGFSHLLPVVFRYVGCQPPRAEDCKPLVCEAGLCGECALSNANGTERLTCAARLDPVPGVICTCVSSDPNRPPTRAEVELGPLGPTADPAVLAWVLLHDCGWTCADCPPGQTLCNAACVPEGTPCEAPPLCAAGQVECGGACYAPGTYCEPGCGADQFHCGASCIDIGLPCDGVCLAGRVPCGPATCLAPGAVCAECGAGEVQCADGCHPIAEGCPGGPFCLTCQCFNGLEAHALWDRAQCPFPGDADACNAACAQYGINGALTDCGAELAACQPPPVAVDVGETQVGCTCERGIADACFALACNDAATLGRACTQACAAANLGADVGPSACHEDAHQCGGAQLCPTLGDAVYSDRRLLACPAAATAGDRRCGPNQVPFDLPGCGCGCGTWDLALGCPNPEEPGVRYASHDLAVCQTQDWACDPGQRKFFNPLCGCGCVGPAVSHCPDPARDPRWGYSSPEEFGCINDGPCDAGELQWSARGCGCGCADTQQQPPDRACQPGPDDVDLLVFGDTRHVDNPFLCPEGAVPYFDPGCTVGCAYPRVCPVDGDPAWHPRAADRVTCQGTLLDCGPGQRPYVHPACGCGCLDL